MTSERCQLPKNTSISPEKPAKPGKPQPASMAMIMTVPINGSCRSKPAHLIHVQRLDFIAQIAAQGEGQRGQKTVRHHDDHRAGDADQAQAGDAQKGKTHVGHAGIADEQVQVALAHGHQRRNKDVAQAQRRR